MDPYEILGVSRAATSEEIRTAYRQLVKKYHPDVNPSPDAVQQTALINQAYDLLTGPQMQSTTFNENTTYEYEVEEDPLEAYKREYKARKFREAREKKEARLRFQKRVYWTGRMFSFPAALLSIIVILDFFIPRQVEHNVPLLGYQRVIRGKHSSHVESYMRMSENDIEVPDEMHLNYDYDAVQKRSLYLEFTPLLSSLTRVGVDYDDYSIVYEAPSSPYVYYFFPLPYIILAISLLFIIKREYSIHRYPFCMFPLVIGFILLMKIMAA